MADNPKLKLSRPIQAHGEDVIELTFREPTGNDILRCGEPFIVGGKIDTDAMTGLISALSNIPRSSVTQLRAFEFMGAQEIVLGFFTAPNPEPSSTATAS